MSYEEEKDLQNEDAEEELKELDEQCEADAAEAAAEVTAEVAEAVEEVEADEVLKDLATDTPIEDEKKEPQRGVFVDRGGNIRPLRRRPRGGRGFEA